MNVYSTHKGYRTVWGTGVERVQWSAFAPQHTSVYRFGTYDGCATSTDVTVVFS